MREKRYPTADWNIYCAQASDGYNSGGDSRDCVALLAEAILPLTQYYAYIEIPDEGEMDCDGEPRHGTVARLRRAKDAAPNFAMKRVARARRHLSRLPRTLRKQAETERRHDRDARRRASARAIGFLFDGAEWDFADRAARLRRRSKTSR